VEIKHYTDRLSRNKHERLQWKLNTIQIDLVESSTNDYSGN